MDSHLKRAASDYFSKLIGQESDYSLRMRGIVLESSGSGQGDMFGENVEWSQGAQKYYEADVSINRDSSFQQTGVRETSRTGVALLSAVREGVTVDELLDELVRFSGSSSDGLARKRELQVGRGEHFEAVEVQGVTADRISDTVLVLFDIASPASPFGI